MNSNNRQADKNCQANLSKILLIIILAVATVNLVYFTGGTKKVYVHLLYVPIILSSLSWGTYVGLLAGVISGILVGPFMPLDVSQGIMQDPINWMSRLLIYSLIGFITGFMTDRIDKLNEEKHERNLKSPYYDLPNAQKLFYDIEERIRSRDHFKLISVKLTNLSDIEKYVDNALIFDIVNNLVKRLTHCCGRKAVYSYEKDELILLACKDCTVDYEERVKQVLEEYFIYPLSINGYKLRVSLKAGIYVYQGEDNSPIEIYNKARIAYEQGEVKESGIYYYDVSLERKRRDIHKITGALLESIQRDELYLMYQPKIDIVNNRISGVEALVRWNRNGDNSIGPKDFIPIAEEIGFITKISRFVLDNVTTQMEIWKSKGMNIKCSVNSSIYEFNDDDFHAWARDMIDSKGIDRSELEIELTERAIAYNDKELIEKMNYLKNKGYQISIDDFGTGYNSLMSVGELPYDKLKVDKYFIDRINEKRITILVKHIIEYAHTLGKTVIAEGVETEEQINILKSLNFDEVQGFYYSKPLLPEEFEKFYASFE
jgi:EAL domain-containing protein (putative c-di-GMP-specific phosphodiesterase class I)/GGDEF domain-containing protein